MRFRCLAFFLLAGLVYGQAAQPAPPRNTTAGDVTAAASDKAPEVEVGPNDPVITVNEFCADSAKAGDACKTVITRVQFEKLTEALQPGMPLSLRLNVANAYARNLRMSAAAEKRGLDKTPAYEEEMRFARMQLLAQDLSRELQAEANDISEADLEDYYKKHESSFEEATAARIFIPPAKQIVPTQKGHEETDAITKLAADLRARAVNGEDPDRLQMEAYTAAGLPGTTSNTRMENVRRDTLPPPHEKVMDLKPGEVSAVFADPEGASFIYKMISKQTLTLENAKTEIRGIISSQRYRDSMKGFEGNVVFSDAYFNPPGKVATPRRNRRAGRKKLRVQRDQNPS